MSKLRCTLLAVAISALAVAGCGGDDEEAKPAEAELTSISEIEVPTTEFDSTEDFTAAADDVCEQAITVYQRYPVFGFNPPAVAAETAKSAEQAEQRLAKLSELEAPADVGDDYDAYLTNAEKSAEVTARVSEDAGSGDTDAMNAGFDELNKLAGEREQLAKEIGFQVCGVVPTALEPEPTGTEPAEGLEYPEPANTIEDAATEWVEAVRSRDCIERTGELMHSQGPEFGSVGCEAEAPFYAEAEVVASEQYGPVGVATLDAGEDFFTYDADFVIDSDGALHFTGVRMVDGTGIAPANEGNDADESAAAFTEAIRANDPDAFNEALTVDLAEGPGTFRVDGPFDSFGSDEENSTQMVADVRADEEAAPEPLGINTGAAYYLLEANDNQYVLVLAHQPGSDTEYRLTAYWALDTDEATEAT